MDVNLEYTSIFAQTNEALYNDKYSFIINQGGTRSSKTHSIIQCLILYALNAYGNSPGPKTISIVRESLPVLKRTTLKDFINIMQRLKLYDIKKHNRTEHTYTFPNGTIIQFLSGENEDKLMGIESDIVWFNEGTGIYDDAFMQLNMRCTYKTIVDFNPKSNVVWLEKLLQHTEKSRIIKSTYLDNPFLHQRQIEEIEFLKHTDPGMYLIYAKGEFAQTQEHVLTHWKVAPKPAHLTEVSYGLDFGWNHPTALVRVWHDGSGREFHFEEVVFESSLTIEALGEIMATEVGYDADVHADSARPDAISQLNDLGFAVHKSDKAVKKGLEVLKTSIITIDEMSGGIIKDFEHYKYKKIRGKFTDEVQKIYDDGPDAARYACVFLREMSGGMSFTMG